MSFMIDTKRFSFLAEAQDKIRQEAVDEAVKRAKKLAGDDASEEDFAKALELELKGVNEPSGAELVGDIESSFVSGMVNEAINGGAGEKKELGALSDSTDSIASAANGATTALAAQDGQQGDTKEQKEANSGLAQNVLNGLDAAKSGAVGGANAVNGAGASNGAAQKYTTSGTAGRIDCESGEIIPDSSPINSQKSEEEILTEALSAKEESKVESVLARWQNTIVVDASKNGAFSASSVKQSDLAAKVNPLAVGFVAGAISNVSSAASAAIAAANGNSSTANGVNGNSAASNSSTANGADSIESSNSIESKTAVNALDSMIYRGGANSANVVEFKDEVRGEMVSVPLNEQNAAKIKEKFGSLNSEEAVNFVRSWYYDAAYTVGYLGADASGDGVISAEEAINLRSFVNMADGKSYALSDFMSGSSAEEMSALINELGFSANMGDFINEMIAQDENMDAKMSYAELLGDISADGATFSFQSTIIGISVEINGTQSLMVSRFSMNLAMELLNAEKLNFEALLKMGATNSNKDSIESSENPSSAAISSENSNEKSADSIENSANSSNADSIESGSNGVIKKFGEFATLVDISQVLGDFMNNEPLFLSGLNEAQKEAFAKSSTILENLLKSAQIHYLLFIIVIIRASG